MFPVEQRFDGGNQASEGELFHVKRCCAISVSLQANAISLRLSGS
jgi:hypothetical protein